MTHNTFPTTTRMRIASKHQKPCLAITMGDPAGIGPEIIVKALNSKTVWQVCHPIIVGSGPILEKEIRRLGMPLKIVTLQQDQIKREVRKIKKGYVPILESMKKPLPRFPSGLPSYIAGKASIEFIKMAVNLAQNRGISGIVTAPINKKSINLAGCNFPGHTELLANLTKTKEFAMMLLGGPLKILFVTTHVSIRRLPRILSSHRVFSTIRLAHSTMQKDFHMPRPKIGVAALNPHAGEHGLFGTEEQDIIAPAIHKAKKAGIRVTDPLPADTLFGAAVKGAYDVIVAMYHDQGLIPLKTVAFGQCVNLTVGLPIIRTSVDHGTAYDIVGKDSANPQSLIEAIKLAAQLAPND